MPVAGVGYTNPYDPWTGVTPPRFVGRIAHLRRLENALEERRSISLVGDWRMGKSSLLDTWAVQAHQRGRVVCRVSGQCAEGAVLSAFVTAITGMKAPNDPDPAADVLADWVATVNQPGLPPLILVDESDTLFSRFDHRLFERLRGMLGKLCLIMTTRREIDDICRDLGRTSPFLNRLELVQVGLLEPEAAEDLIRQGESFFHPGDAQLLSDWAGRHPFYLQLLGHHLVDARNNGETHQDALDRFYAEARVRLREWWQTLTERERETLNNCLAGVPVTRRVLRIRGCVTEEGRLFGQVLAEWLREEI